MYTGKTLFVPLRLFEGYSSYLQADGYASYEAVCRQQGITLLGSRAEKIQGGAGRQTPEQKKAEHPRRPIWPCR
jgi:hypothetical protein